MEKEKGKLSFAKVLPFRLKEKNGQGRGYEIKNFVTRHKAVTKYFLAKFSKHS